MWSGDTARHRSPEEDERVTEPQAISRLLHEAAQAGVTCSIRVSSRADQHLAKMLAFDEQNETLAFEPPRAPYLERAMAPGIGANVDIKDGGRRGTFDTRVVGIVRRNGGTALLLARPDAVVRHLRRESFRVAVPASVALRLTIDPDDVRGRDLPVENVGPDGMMVSLAGSLDRFEPGRTFDRGSIVLPDGQSFQVALRVRHAAATRMSGPAGELKVGLRFVQPPAGLEPALSRLIDSIAKATRR
jgi:c-di-GMP-binding flagellar brake protein YcgR